MCFAPQRRALFRHRNFQKWSDHGVFCTFWLGNVLRATTACNFSSLIWPAGSAPTALASLLFDPPEPQIIGKHSESRLSYLFTHLHLLSSYSFSSTLLSSDLFSSLLPLPCSAFHLSILSEVWRLNFLRIYDCWRVDLDDGASNPKKSTFWSDADLFAFFGHCSCSSCDFWPRLWRHVIVVQQDVLSMRRWQGWIDVPCGLV